MYCPPNPKKMAEVLYLFTKSHVENSFRLNILKVSFHCFLTSVIAKEKFAFGLSSFPL